MTAADAAIARLHADLQARATERSLRFWEGYVKEAPPFRGVPMGQVRAAVTAWWKREGLHAATPAAQKRTALALFDGDFTEDRLAGVLALSEILLPHLGRRDLPAFARLFAGGRIADWNLCDWFCVKVLGRMVASADDPADLAGAVAAWRTAKPLWQRRAACVAFVELAADGEALVPGLPDLVVGAAQALVQDPARFAQTGVGWVLRQLSLHDRARVVAFAEAHLTQLSREAVRSLSEKMPAAEQKRLVGLHRAAGGG